MSSLSSLPYSSSSEYSPSFSVLPPTFHIFRLFAYYLQNSDDPACAFVQEYIIVLHFKTKKNVFDDTKVLLEVLGVFKIILVLVDLFGSVSISFQLLLFLMISIFPALISEQNFCLIKRLLCSCAMIVAGLAFLLIHFVKNVVNKVVRYYLNNTIG